MIPSLLELMALVVCTGLGFILGFAVAFHGRITFAEATQDGIGEADDYAVGGTD